jgi:hypothetical protein
VTPDGPVIARLRAAMAAGPAAATATGPEPAIFPALASGTCPGCGGKLCGHCARIYGITSAHLRDDGTCPWGHREAAGNGPAPIDGEGSDLD